MISKLYFYSIHYTLSIVHYSKRNGHCK